MDGQKDSEHLSEWFGQTFGKPLALPGVPWARWWRKYIEENGKTGGRKRTMTSTSRVAKNTLFLYFRQIFNMLGFYIYKNAFCVISTIKCFVSMADF